MNIPTQFNDAKILSSLICYGGPCKQSNDSEGKYNVYKEEHRIVCLKLQHNLHKCTKRPIDNIVTQSNIKNTLHFACCVGQNRTVSTNGAVSPTLMRNDSLCDVKNVRYELGFNGTGHIAWVRST